MMSISLRPFTNFIPHSTIEREVKLHWYVSFYGHMTCKVKWKFVSNETYERSTHLYYVIYIVLSSVEPVFTGGIEVKRWLT